MTLSPWLSLLLAVPVLLAGEFLVRRVRLLSRFNIPAPVVGGLLVALGFFATNLTGLAGLQFGTEVSARWWTWLVTIEPAWVDAPLKSVNLPFLVAFFTCIGLNASWDIARRGSVQVLIFLALSTVLAMMQNALGVALARLLGAPPLLGVVCGGVSLMGGMGTAMGFAPDLEKAGLAGAAVLGVAAATFGLVAGGLVGGPVGGALIRKHQLKPATADPHLLAPASTGESGFLPDVRHLLRLGRAMIAHALVLLVCIKAGVWVSHFLQQTGMTFPVYIGAMLVGVAVRNAFDLSGRPWIKTEIVDTLAAVLLGVFLSVAMMTLNLARLADTALPMLIILAAQVAVMAAFAWFVTFRAMGRDFDAAVMAGGQCGFGLGATPNAIANMKSLVENFGPAPRAFLVVPIVGAFLIDFLNAVNITFFINLVK